MKTSPAIAKISRPKLSGIAPRERLFAQLDRCKTTPVLWITSPGGSGKTTLVGSYLDARNLPSLWYQLDQGDGDLAGFFHYLGLAAKKAAPRYKKPLPHLTPEYLLGIPVFTRRYFETLFQRLPDNAVMVFDNYQDVPDGSGFPEMLSQALEVIPDGIRVIILSRSESPPALSRLKANRCIAELSWDDMRFTPEESIELLTRHGHSIPPESILKELHQRTSGWAAGLVLLTAQPNLTAPVPDTPGDLSSREVFAYFANEIFDRTAPEIQDLLLRTSFMNKVDPVVAAKLTGISTAGDILERLHRNHYFTQRYERGYQYHPLFKEFLLDRTRERFSPEQLSGMQRQAAALFEESGAYVTAAGLYLQAGDWENLGRLALGHAPLLASQGRWQTLTSWLSAIPPAIMESAPWLAYWLGVSQLPFTPAAARSRLETAYRSFHEQGDTIGMLLACSGAIDSIAHNWDDYRPMDAWITRIEELHIPDWEKLPPDVAARVALSLATALAIRQPYRADVAAGMERSMALTRASSDLNLQFQGMLLAQNYYGWMGDLSRCRFLASEAARLAQMPAVSPLFRLTSLWVDTAVNLAASACFDKAQQTLEKGQAIARDTGIHVLNHLFTAIMANAFLYKGDMEQARCCIEKFQGMLDPARPHSHSLYHYEMTWYHLLLGQTDQAVSHAASSVRIATEAGYLFPEITARIIEAHALLASGDAQKSRAALDYTERLMAPTGSVTMRFHWLLIASHHAFEHGDDVKGLDFLKEAMTTGRKAGFGTVNMWWHPGVMSSLCARALEAGFEVEYTREMIRNHRLSPPDSFASLDAWPWPLKLHTMGRFELLLDGKPVDFSGKRKLLEMLKALVAMGGTAIRQAQVTSLLWPDADGDDAHNSFKMTLSRLRKLLPDEAIQFQDGMLTLNRRLLWVDVWAFEQLCNEASAHWLKSREAGNSVKGTKTAIELTRKTLNLYAGSFLPGDLDQPWTVSQRERQRTKLLRLTLIAGQHHEEKGKWNSAIGLYRQGLDVDPLQEEFYQRLMICHQQLGQRTEALAVYERCRAELSVHLKIKPAPRTEELYASLRV